MIWRPRTEKGALLGKIFTMCIPKQRFAGFFGYAARKSCQNQLILDTYRGYVATEGVFFRPRPLLAYIKRKSCHGYFATVDTRRTDHCEILPPPNTSEHALVKYRRSHSLQRRWSQLEPASFNRRKQARVPGLSYRPAGPPSRACSTLASFVICT